MLQTFNERNFTNRGLVEMLRSLLFQAHLKLPGRSKFSASERAGLHRIAAECNGHALYCLGSALDYIGATHLDDIDIRGGYLAKLTAHEKIQEKRLMAQLGGLCSPRSDWRQCFEGDQEFRSLGRIRKFVDARPAGCAAGELTASQAKGRSRSIIRRSRTASSPCCEGTRLARLLRSCSCRR
jgi:hypothetical protein